jgi:hypothetical protein
MSTSGHSATIGRKRRIRASLLRRAIAHRQDLALAAGATGWLLLAWLVLDVLPWKLYRKMMHPAVRTPEMETEKAPAFVARVSWAVQAVARRVPWRAVCFHQGIAAQQMLCRAGIGAELHYGVAKSPEKGLEAHVWVTANGLTVVGGKTRDRFAELGLFAARSSSLQPADFHAEETLPPQ